MDMSRLVAECFMCDTNTRHTLAYTHHTPHSAQLTSGGTTPWCPIFLSYVSRCNIYPAARLAFIQLLYIILLILHKWEWCFLRDPSATGSETSSSSSSLPVRYLALYCSASRFWGHAKHISNRRKTIAAAAGKQLANWHGQRQPIVAAIRCAARPSVFILFYHMKFFF